MATAIKAIPTLKGKEAREFLRHAEEAGRNTFARLSSLFILKPLVFRNFFCIFAPECSTQIRICYVTRREKG